MAEGERRFYGIFRGRVLSAADPQRKGRLEVSVPQVNGDGTLGWALPCFPFLTQQPKLQARLGDSANHTHPVTGTTEKITLRLPKRGDAVWVMFENGSHTSPVWLGSWIGV